MRCLLFFPFPRRLRLSHQKPNPRPPPPLTRYSQIPSTASLFFASHPTLWLIKLRYADIAPDTRWEGPPGADGDDVPFFPHLYGRSFGPADAEGVERFDRDGRDWKEVLGASSWLV